MADLEDHFQKTGKTVEAKILKAADYLAPFFGLTTEHLNYPKPKVYIKTKKDIPKCCGLYTPSENLIIVREDHVNDELTLGEETSHYIHFHISPWSANGDEFQTFRLYAALETVGRYGGLVYLELIGQKIPSVEKLREDYKNSNELLQHFAHKFGYGRAHFIMSEFGSTKLSEISRSSVNKIDDDYKGLPSVETYYKYWVEPRLNEFSKHPLD